MEPETLANNGTFLGGMNSAPCDFIRRPCATYHGYATRKIFHSPRYNCNSCYAAGNVRGTVQRSGIPERVIFKHTDSVDVCFNRNRRTYE